MRIDKPDSVETCNTRDERTHSVQRGVELRVVHPTALPQGGELDTDSAKCTIESGRLDRHEPVDVFEEEQIRQQRIFGSRRIQQSIERDGLVRAAAVETEQQSLKLAALLGVRCGFQQRAVIAVGVAETVLPKD